MVSLRTARIEDLFSIERCNLLSLPENYQMKYYYFHLLSWPELTQVAEDERGKIVGYVLAKMEDDTNEKSGHITSIAVSRSHRQLGIATKLLSLSQSAMEMNKQVEYVSLHVRVTNRAAFNMYTKSLGYSVTDIEEQYYGDKEDAFYMQHYFPYGVKMNEIRRHKREERLKTSYQPTLVFDSPHKVEKIEDKQFTKKPNATVGNPSEAEDPHSEKISIGGKRNRKKKK